MIFLQLKQQLNALNDLISKLNDVQYSQKIAHLGNASIGGHIRHIIELLLCATDGFSSGEVDYINRKRNMELENSRMIAQNSIQSLSAKISKTDKKLELIIEDGENVVNTTYYREIVYNTEHTIHHLALIKVALIEMNLDLVDENFGMAYSTIRFKASLV
jgi:hypothetical protein